MTSDLSCIPGLRSLNFNELIQLNVDDATQYSFEDYATRYNLRHPIKGFCTSCEKQSINTSISDSTFTLQNISHGAHSSDFIASLPTQPDTTNWNTKPIMFVYESPSIDRGIYEKTVFQGITKKPSKEWYWVHGRRARACTFPEHFKGGSYGEFILSAILTFKLANVYMTNLIKCGLNNPENRYQGIDQYKPECIKNCYNTYLKKEIDIHKPLVVFAVGSSVEKRLREFLPKSIFVQQIPHPAGQRRGFKDEHYKVLYFWLLVQAFFRTGIITNEEVAEFANVFTKHYQSNTSG